MDEVMILVTLGKGDSRPDSAKVVLAANSRTAEDYCNEINSAPKQKYWTKAEIVSVGEEIELTWPE